MEHGRLFDHEGSADRTNSGMDKQDTLKEDKDRWFNCLNFCKPKQKEAETNTTSKEGSLKSLEGRVDALKGENISIETENKVLCRSMKKLRNKYMIDAYEGENFWHTGEGHLEKIFLTSFGIFEPYLGRCGAMFLKTSNCRNSQ